MHFPCRGALLCISRPRFAAVLPVPLVNHSCS
jgi:hypothetical protein